MSRGEKNCLIVFFTAVALWILPGVVALIAGEESAIYTTVLNRLDEGTVAIVAAALLFLLPVNWAERRFTMNWNEAAGIDWGTILLFGCGIALGTLMGETGFAEVIGTSIADTLGFTSLLAITGVSALIAILISETTSNTASATIVVPIVIPIAQAAGVDPLIPALGAVFGASFGFMLPVSTPQNAVVYGSGIIPITRMVRSGAVFDIAGIILIVALIPVMARVVGLA
jgi:sodium-dependent dicarboxylate transporter 2/3/5